MDEALGRGMMVCGERPPVGRVTEPKGLPGGHTESPDAGPPPTDPGGPRPASGCGFDAGHVDAGQTGPAGWTRLGADASPCQSACTVGAKRCGPRGALQICALDEISMCPDLGERRLVRGGQALQDEARRSPDGRLLHADLRRQVRRRRRLRRELPRHLHAAR
jgi:hypothetical protein